MVDAAETVVGCLDSANADDVFILLQNWWPGCRTYGYDMNIFRSLANDVEHLTTKRKNRETKQKLKMSNQYIH